MVLVEHSRNSPNFTCLYLVDPATYRDTTRNGLLCPQESDVILDGRVELWKGQEIKTRHLVGCFRAQVVLDDGARVLVLEGKHTTASMLDDVDLVGAKELLRDDETTKSLSG